MMTDLTELLERARADYRSWWDDPDDEAEHDADALVALHDLGRETLEGPDIDEAVADRLIGEGVELLASEDPIDRRFAVQLLRELTVQERRVAGALLDYAQREDDPELLYQAVNGLYFGGDDRAIPFLLTLTGHDSADVRYAVAGALSSCSAPTMKTDARNALLRLATDEEDDVRYSALYELASWWEHERFRDPPIRAALEVGTRDHDESIRTACAEALAAP